MVPSNARKSAGGPQVAVTKSAMNDILAILAKHNPSLSKSALKTTGRVVAALSAAAVRLSREQQRQIVAHENDLAKVMENVVSELTGDRTRHDNDLIAMSETGPIEEITGEGFGKLLSAAEGKKRVVEYATPVRLEDWAGVVAGPGEIERDFGTKRSTLHDWQKRGAVIGLLRGERKHVYPLAQFIDGRPIEGMTQITRLVPNSRAAWLWLTRPHPTGDGSPPLDRLKQGRIDEVAAAAERDFG